MRWSALLAMVTTFLLVCIPGQRAVAAEESCSGDADWKGSNMDCRYSTEQAREEYHKSSSTVRHQLVLECKFGIAVECVADFARCHAEEKSLYKLERAAVGTEDWEFVAWVCLGDESEVTEGVTEVEVRRAFKELTWPGAELVIQPPGGETLVNLATIFYTPDTGPISQTVTLLGIDVEIEATPASWTWHWVNAGDDATPDDRATFTTDHPGAAHPNETITHAYARAGTVRPSVDVTYSGRFRVGEGEWVDIAENHAVPGDPEQLTVLEARPVLIP